VHLRRVIVALTTAGHAFVPVYCRVGNEVELRTYDGATHGSVLLAARAEVLTWFADRLAGAPAPSSCAAR
jgi:hypothetical protein